MQTHSTASVRSQDGAVVYACHELPQRADLPACPVETCLKIMGNKWKPLILRDLLANETMRFNELQRSVSGISQKVLTSNLRQMEDDGIVERAARLP